MTQEQIKRGALELYPESLMWLGDGRQFDTNKAARDIFIAGATWLLIELHKDVLERISEPDGEVESEY